MTKTLFEKMFLKPNYTLAVLHLPEELAADLVSQQEQDNSLKSTYNFFLAFYSKDQKLKEEAVKFKESLLPNGLLWIAYPKNKALETDINRDILHERMKNFGFDGVSLISLSATWSAMRFKAL